MNAPSGNTAAPSTVPAERSHQTIHRFLVKPVDAGTLGSVDGGKLLEWIDKVAFAAAAQWSGRYCVTAYVGNVHLTGRSTSVSSSSSTPLSFTPGAPACTSW